MKTLATLSALLLAACALAQVPSRVMLDWQMAARSTQSAVPLPDILRWDMTDGAGTNITATVGANGVTDGSWISGWVTGGALEFNGSSTEAQSSGAVTFGTNMITVAFSLWLDATNGASPVILESSANFNNTADSFICYLNTDGTFAAGIRGQASRYRIGTCVAFGAGQWHHVLIVYDHAATAGNVSIFFNGTNQNATQSTAGQSAINAAANFSAQTLNVASRNRTGSWMDGRIGKLWIYSGDQSASATAIMNAQK